MTEAGNELFVFILLTSFLRTARKCSSHIAFSLISLKNLCSLSTASRCLLSSLSRCLSGSSLLSLFLPLPPSVFAPAHFSPLSLADPLKRPHRPPAAFSGGGCCYCVLFWIDDRVGFNHRGNEDRRRYWRPAPKCLIHQTVPLPKCCSCLNPPRPDPNSVALQVLWRKGSVGILFY